MTVLVGTVSRLLIVLNHVQGAANAGSAATSAPTTTAPVQQTTGNDLLGDLAGLGLGAPAAESSSSPPDYGSAMASSDPTVLTDQLSGLSLDSSAPAQPVQTQSGIDLLGDLFGAPSAPAPSAAPPVQAAPTAAAATPNFMDDLMGGPSLLGDLGSLGSVGSGAAMGGPVSELAGSALSGMGNPSEIPFELQKSPHRRDTGPISADTSINVTVAHVWEAEALTLVLFFENKTPGPLHGVSVAMDVSAPLQLLPGSPSDFLLSFSAQNDFAQQVNRRYTFQTLRINLCSEPSFRRYCVLVPQPLPLAFLSRAALHTEMVKRGFLT